MSGAFCRAGLRFQNADRLGLTLVQGKAVGDPLGHEDFPLVGSQTQIASISGGTWLFLLLSGLSTGASWLCYYRALQDGPASVVVPIDKLSILVTVAFSYFVFHERLSKKSGVGLALVVAGTLAMLF